MEVKFNPWHDEENGRFTFAGQGRYFGAGRTGMVEPARMARPSRTPRLTGRGGASNAESEESGIKRWSIMEYEIKDGKFDVSFKYPDEVHVETISMERREAALRARFGDKPVVYPPMPNTAFELKP